MRLRLTVCAAVSCLALLPGLASAKGCLKGAAVGGVGGHVAGHHGVIGAAAGCVIGRHMANKKEAVANAPTAPATPAPSRPALARP